MIFSEIVKDFLIAASSSIEARICPDQYVGIISDFGQANDDFPERQDAASRPDDTPCLIIILESLHTDEFVGNVGPAKGTTGRLIRSHMHTMDCFPLYSNYGLILMNAIPYQCSLGFPTECFRDCIFKRVWSLNGRASFVGRLERYLRSGDVVANCCTRGHGLNGEELRALVQAALLEIQPDLTPMRRTHPSSWYSQRNRDAEWKYKTKTDN